MRRTSTVLLPAVAALVAACSGGAGTPAGEPAPATRKESPPATASDPTASGPALPQGAAAQTAENAGKWDLVLTDVRVAEHDGYDRIVLEFRGTGTPGWAVSYVDRAVLDGSGEKVRLDGDAILDIYASGTTYPVSDGASYGGPTQFEPDGGVEVDEVHVGGTFEGYTQVLAGLTGGPNPFRVFALTDPSRLVVDVDGSAD